MTTCTRNLGTVSTLRRTPRVHALPPGLYGATPLDRATLVAHAAETRAILAYPSRLAAIVGSRDGAWLAYAGVSVLLTLAPAFVALLSR